MVQSYGRRAAIPAAQRSGQLEEEPNADAHEYLNRHLLLLQHCQKRAPVHCVDAELGHNCESFGDSEWKVCAQQYAGP